MSDASVEAVEAAQRGDRPARWWLSWPVLWGVGVLVVAVLSYFFIDRGVARWVHDLPRPVRNVASAVTRGGDAAYTIGGVLALVGLTWLITRRLHLQRAVLPVAAIAGSGIAVNLIKIVVGRYRPNSLFSQNAYGFWPFSVGYHTNGFPSAHAATIVSACAVLWLTWPRWRAVWLPVAIVVAASRVFTNSHYVSDVLVGGFIGVLMGVLVCRVWQARIGPLQRAPASN